MGEIQSGFNEKGRGFYCHECENFWRKTIRPQLRREGAASAPEKWDGTYTGILESMDSGERGREPVGEMGRSQFPDHGRTQGRLRPSFIRKTRLSGHAGTSVAAPFIRNKRLTAADWDAALLTGEKQLL
ncbi:hypothetical protein B4135_0649 [Caldibacillus debilis]|uniref:Uncharacterized protein n=1 Tax=Caldibacillus debilis TaxID=301148 RepID=A0A150MF05_9BACI|nr:hypothetical protein B4135_0649 [Caldibacillus debilis]